MKPLREEEDEFPYYGEIDFEQNLVDTEEDSVITRGEDLPKVNLSKYHTEGKESHYIQINHIVNNQN